MAVYGKLNSETKEIEYMPNVLVVDDITYVKYDNEFPIEIIHEAGYKEVVTSNPPEEHLEEDHYWESSWKETKLKITQKWAQVEDDTTPIQRRQNAYQNKPIIEFGNEIITVDEARNLCNEYIYDGTERATEIITELSAKIANAKQQIRELYPDKE